MGARSIVSCAALALALPWAAGALATQPAEETTPESLYQQSVEACAAGDDAGRRKALKAALAIDPDYEPARAEFGYVRLEGDWVLAEVAQAAAESDPRRREYERLRAQSDDTVADHERLARWCDTQGLAFEARPHWLMVLRSEPKHGEALESLGVVLRGGRVWDAELFETAKQKAKDRERSAALWEKRFRRFETRRHVDQEALREIRSGMDANAVTPIERRIANLGSAEGVRSVERSEALIDAFFDACPSMDEAEVTASLCRIAVAADEKRRRQAIELLGSRPEADSVPLLLGWMVSPIDSGYRISRDRLGNVTYQHQLSRQGMERDRLHDRTRVTRVSVGTTSVNTDRIRSYTTSQSIYNALMQARFEGVKNQIRFMQEAEETVQTVADHNALAAGVNGRVVNALTQLTGQSLGDDPAAWWDYWRSYSGYDSYERPVDRTYESSYEVDQFTATPTLVRLPPPPPSPRCECFVAGTPVWTRDGKRPIETLRRGDLVLSRDPDRGGLVYRAVLDTTTRRPSPMVQIDTGEELIHATVGHPFWVVGEGWCMAKHLTAGNPVSTISGPVEVVSVSDYADREAFNLVVEGAANYYVGETGVLVHDNTPRRPAAGLVARR